MTDGEILSNGPPDRPEHRRAATPLRLRRSARAPVVPVLSVLVVVLAVALVISLVDRPTAKVKVGSATDSIRIACAELDSVDSHAQLGSRAFNLNPIRMGMASALAQVAVQQDHSIAPVSKVLEQPAVKENLTFTLDPKALAAALAACKKY